MTDLQTKFLEAYSSLTEVRKLILEVTLADLDYARFTDPVVLDSRYKPLFKKAKFKITKQKKWRKITKTPSKERELPIELTKHYGWLQRNVLPRGLISDRIIALGTLEVLGIIKTCYRKPEARLLGILYVTIDDAKLYECLNALNQPIIEGDKEIAQTPSQIILNKEDIHLHKELYFRNDKNERGLILKGELHKIAPLEAKIIGYLYQIRLKPQSAISLERLAGVFSKTNNKRSINNACKKLNAIATSLNYPELIHTTVNDKKQLNPNLEACKNTV